MCRFSFSFSFTFVYFAKKSLPEPVYSKNSYKALRFSLAALQHLTISFSPVPADQALDQTINRQSKTSGWVLSALAVIMELCMDADSSPTCYVHLEMSQFSWSCNWRIQAPFLRSLIGQASIKANRQQLKVLVSQLVFLSVSGTPSISTYIVQFTKPLCGAMRWLLDHHPTSLGGNGWSITTSDNFK